MDFNRRTFQLTSFANWEEIGRWFSSLARPKVMVSPEIRSKAEELTKGKSSEEERIRAIYDFVSLVSAISGLIWD